jgi:hypothetical protein
MSGFQDKLNAKKPVIIAFAAGLLLGPFISGTMGWQVKSSTVKSMVHNAAVAQQIKVCQWRARGVVADPSKLEYMERFKLAEEWAKMPWQQEADSEVVSGCSNSLSESV